MNYQQSKAAFEAMDNLETYSKLHTFEMSKDDTDWDAVNRYSDNIEVARCKLFKMLEAAS